MTDKRRQSLYFPAAMLADMVAQAKRLDRPVSWVVQQAWRYARETIAKMPSMTGVKIE